MSFQLEIGQSYIDETRKLAFVVSELVPHKKVSASDPCVYVFGNSLKPKYKNVRLHLGYLFEDGSFSVSLQGKRRKIHKATQAEIDWFVKTNQNKSS